MIRFTPTSRRIARDIARAGTLLSAAMFVFGLLTAGSNAPRAAAAVNAGTVQILVPPGQPTAGQPMLAGGSATGFAMIPPTGASCTGDSTTGGYRVQSYMVPASIQPSSLTFGSTGPIPAGTGASLRQPLFSSGTPFIQRTTAVAAADGSGLLINLPVLSFSVFGADGPTIVPPGTYNIGYACTLGPASATQIDKYWNAQLIFAVDDSDSPSKITWTVAAPVDETTTSSTATTVVEESTTTIAPASSLESTSTTTQDSTSTTTAVDSTSTTTASAATSSTVGSGAITATTFRPASSAPSGTLVATGTSSMSYVVWGVLLLVFGRMAILLARPVRVRHSEMR